MDLTRPSPSSLARYWTLDPVVTFLNHGSFGACPAFVLAAQQELRVRLERQPVQFLGRDLEPLLDAARASLALWLHSDVEDLVFVPNATTGVNAVLRSLSFQAGDEILVTDHGYNACSNAANYVAERAGAKVVVASVPFPLRSADEVVTAVLAAVTPRTKIALLDHVTSPTGLVFPIEKLVRALEAKGVPTLIDGAHAPGMLPLDLRALNATYYTGNCHKWLCAPKGVGFLWCRRSAQHELRPHVISHGASSLRTDRSRFQQEFDWVGTGDPTALLSVPKAIEFMGSLVPGGWPALMQRNRALALEGRQVLANVMGVEPPAPEEMIGTLVAMPLPDATAKPVGGVYVDALQEALRARHSIEVPVFPFPAWPRRLIRISAQLYNSVEQYRYLGSALEAELDLRS